jgi:hypothetical protein
MYGKIAPERGVLYIDSVDNVRSKRRMLFEPGRLPEKIRPTVVRSGMPRGSSTAVAS